MPGFAYLGGLSDRDRDAAPHLAAHRRTGGHGRHRRTADRRVSARFAGRMESDRHERRCAIFDIARAEPALLATGDRVRFRADLARPNSGRLARRDAHESSSGRTADDRAGPRATRRISATAIPAGGAMDRHRAAALANLLVGNTKSAAGLEATLIGPAIAFDERNAHRARRRRSRRDDRSVPLGRLARRARARAASRCASASRSRAVARTSRSPVASTCRRSSEAARRICAARSADVDGRALRAGDALALWPAQSRLVATHRGIARTMTRRELGVARWSVGVTLRPPYSDEPIVRVIAGAHTDSARRQRRATRLSADAFRVSSSSDRMGYRLEGPPLELREPSRAAVGGRRRSARCSCRPAARRSC